MPNTFTFIASSTVGSGGASTIEFTSIPQTYTDLLVMLSTRTNRNDGDYDNIKITFNNSTSGFSARTLGTVLNNVFSGQNLGQSNAIYTLQYGSTATLPANIFANGCFYIPNYTSSNNKSIISDMGYPNSKGSAPNNDWLLTMGAGLWSNTSAITSILLDPEYGSSFVQHSTAYLYGIKKN